MRTPVTFTLDTDKDRDILRWLEARPNKSAAVREAIRAHLGSGDITLADVYRAVQDLKHHGVMIGASQEPAGDEPPDVAAALDNLGL